MVLSFLELFIDIKKSACLLSYPHNVRLPYLFLQTQTRMSVNEVTDIFSQLESRPTVNTECRLQ